MEKEKKVNPDSNDDQGVLRILRDAPPAHYSLRIEPFSGFTNLGIDKYESDAFDVGGYTWRIVIYPKGNTKRGIEGHISLYLVIDKTESLPLGWEAYATYKIFLYDHNKDKYLTIQSDPAQQVRFHREKKENGFDKLIPLDTFSVAANGYLIDDSCIFGVEIFPVKYTGNGETLVMNIVEPTEVTFEWKIDKFSKICKRKPNGRIEFSDQFAVGKYKWRLMLYPNGDSTSKDCVSLFLELVKGPPTGKKVLTEFSLGIRNQICDQQQQASVWFSTNPSSGDGTNRDMGWSKFILLKQLQSESISSKPKDDLLIQAKVMIKAEVANFS
ncbi:uncharacterized protein LOC108216340 [Daucus carota subsp. sativus]|uniref:uncharacterized protein LOC108216340 n=1 Tax=Daucus carota subsp. sativus TaxID=79200 RepID=UPI003082A12E